MSNQKAAVSNTFVGLENTINWDIKTPYPGRGKVPIPKWMTFLTEDVGIELTDMVNVVQHTITGTLLIEMVSKEKFETFLRKAEQGVVWRKYNVMVNGWSAGEEVTMIHLHNVFTMSDLDQITKIMTKYGTIITKQVHVFKQAPNLKNGVVTLKMKLRAQVEIPTFIYDERLSNTVEITSDRHQRTCWKCLDTGHIAAFCRKARQTQASASSSSTWAKIVANGPENATTAEMAVEPEMVRVITPTPAAVIEPEKSKNPPVEPKRVEQRRMEPNRPEPSKPSKPEPSRPEPKQVEPSRPEPSKPEPKKEEPSRPEPSRREPKKVEPKTVEPKKVEPEQPALEQRNRLDSGKWPRPETNQDSKRKQRENWTKSPTQVDKVMKELEKKKQRMSSST